MFVKRLFNKGRLVVSILEVAVEVVVLY